MYNGEFSWPDGAHIAVVFNVSWEIWPQKLGSATNNQRAGETVPKDAKYGRWMMPVYEHAYAETAGMQRLLDIWERYEIPSSYYTDGLAVELYPDLARRVRDAGHEFLVQGWDHSFLWEQTVAEQTESIDKTIDAFEKVLDIAATGFSASAGSITPETFDIVAERGFKYCCGFRNTDVPFIIPRADGKKLVGMNSYALCDYNSYGHADAAPRDLLQMWRDFFDTMYEEGKRGYPQMLAYGTHPFLSHGYRTKPMEEVIEYIKTKPGVWITTRDKIAEWVLEKYPERDLSTFYPEAVSSDRWYGLSMGVGGEEADAEARRFRVE
jgi:peptidoglycan-N-acetylglucosamine deacetylase